MQKNGNFKSKTLYSRKNSNKSAVLFYLIIK